MSETSSDSGRSGSRNSYVYSRSISRPPALTRESTAWETASTLPTPFDGPPIYSNIKSQPPSIASRRNGSAFSVKVRTNDVEDDRLTVAYEEAMESISYFPDVQLPVTPTRRGSTKALISRYENITAASRPTTPTTPRSPLKMQSNVNVDSPSFSRRESPLPPTPATPAPSRPLSQMKAHTPLRESFRNLMSLFGKKGKPKEGTSPASSVYTLDPFLVNQGSPRNMSATGPQLVASPIIENLAPPLKTGSVLYLFPQQAEGPHPVWSNCTASLHPDRILIRWLSAFGNPSRHEIRLEPSANVHSLTWAEVDHTERMLLPEEMDGAHVFELVLDSGVREKFATASVADRSLWVSLIWDALLQLRMEEKSLAGQSLLTTFDRASTSQSYEAMSLPSSSTTHDNESKSEFSRNDVFIRPALKTIDTSGSTTLAGSAPQSAIGTSIRSGMTSSNVSGRNRTMGTSSIISDRNSNLLSPSSATSASECMKPMYSRAPTCTTSRLVDEQRNELSPVERRESTTASERTKYQLQDISYARPASIQDSGSTQNSVPERISLRAPSEVPSQQRNSTQVASSYRGEGLAVPALSRRDTVSSWYSRTSEDEQVPLTTQDVPPTTVPTQSTPTHLPTPPSINRRRSAYARSRSRAPSSQSYNNRPREQRDDISESDTHSIVSSYGGNVAAAHEYGLGRRFGPALSPVLDAGESQLSGTPDLDGVSESGMSRHPTQRSEARSVASSVNPSRQSQNALGGVDTVVLAPQVIDAKIGGETVASDLGGGTGENPLVTLIQDHAVQQYTQTAEVSHQIASLQKDVLDMSRDLREVLAEDRLTKPSANNILKNIGDDSDKNENGSESENPALRTALEELSARLDQLAHEVNVGGDLSGARVDELHEKIDTMTARLLAEHAKAKFGAMAEMADVSGAHTAGIVVGEGGGEVTEAMTTLLGDVGGQLKDNFPAILQAIEELPERIDVSVPAVNLDEIHAKLDDLLKIHVRDQVAVGPAPQATTFNDAPSDSAQTDAVPGALPAVPETQTSSAPNVDTEEMQKKLDEIAAYIREDAERKKQQAEQQVDSVRYLNELNTWLEKFVDNGTSNILNVSQGVQRLCEDLLPPEESASDSTSENDEGATKRKGIVTEIRSLMNHVEQEGGKSNQIQEKLEELLGLTKAAAEEKAASVASDIWTR
ncbi:hypothetical protein SCHPADRAFT_322744 [Schizopora paradoxa]|uniref:PH domain-containing protein n=1 Tax=Schizopora paradoxa TaxID=27342 RepID=A0A0H2SBJ7_9AGAM|nr:hypothetical protein SCHPADRAFT_322744 [Schizopora paradoxa]